jgi:hypothetical protein
MPIAVSVVVPVFNPGPYLEPCVASLLSQTLGRDRYEIILVDDGSTDGTGVRLDRLASEHPGFVRVLHLAPSGWAGRPRNIGTFAARGTYVFYCDADDWLTPRALELLVDRAEQDRSDIVIGRLVGNRRDVPRHLFDAGDYCTTWRAKPGLFNSLATHKLFRRAFLEGRGLRFPEGRVRLEDQIFVVEAYLAAERISIVGSEPCYVYERRDDAANLTAALAEPAAHARSVQRIVDAIVAGTEPGQQRAATLARTLRGELLGRVSGRGYLAQDEEFREAMFREVRHIVTTSVDASTDRLLPAATRVVAELVRRGDRERLEDFARWQASVSAAVTAVDVSGHAGRFRVSADLRLEISGVPLRFRRDGGANGGDGCDGGVTDGILRLIGPDGVELDDVLGSPAGDATDDLQRAGTGLALVSRDTREEWRVAGRTSLRLEPADGAHVTATWSTSMDVDMATVAAVDRCVPASGTSYSGSRRAVGAVSGGSRSPRRRRTSYQLSSAPSRRSSSPSMTRGESSCSTWGSGSDRWRQTSPAGRAEPSSRAERVQSCAPRFQLPSSPPARRCRSPSFAAGGDHGGIRRAFRPTVRYALC